MGSVEGESLPVRSRGRTLPLGFLYATVRSPQWVSERKIEGASDERVRPLIEAELEHNRQRLASPAAVLSNYAAWSQWYARTNNKRFGVSFDPEETGPLADGRYGSKQDRRVDFAGTR